MYKLLSKVLANRMKPLMPLIIFNSQSAFVHGRWISNNILITYELVHFLKRRKIGKQGSISIKLDTSKAYDRVEWGYLEHILVALNFPSHFIHLIMLSVKSATFFVINNGESKGFITPS